MLPTTGKSNSHLRRILPTAGLAALTLISVAIGAWTTAQERPAGSVETRLQAGIDAVIADSRTRFSGALVHVRNSEGEGRSFAARVADPATAEPLAANARFRAGSIAKTFVATVVLQLAEEGRFELDQPITSLLAPEVTGRFPGAERISVRMLLGQTSGLPEWNTPEMHREVAAEPLKVLSSESLLDIAAAQPRPFQPGEGWLYSNTNYTLAGLLIEATTGLPWRTAVRERVIDRLGLKDTLLPEPGDPGIPAPAMHGFSLLGGEPMDFTEVDPSMAGAAGGGALVTTSADLATFLDALRTGRLFAHPETWVAMSSFRDAPAEGFQDGYGLGLQHLTLPNGVELIGHFGSTAGYFAIVAYVPALDVTVSAAINAWPADPGALMSAVLAALAD